MKPDSARSQILLCLTLKNKFNNSSETHPMNLYCKSYLQCELEMYSSHIHSVCSSLSLQVWTVAAVCYVIFALFNAAVEAASSGEGFNPMTSLSTLIDSCEEREGMMSLFPRGFVEAEVNWALCAHLCVCV